MATLLGRALLSAAVTTTTTTTETNSTAHAPSAGHGGETDPLWFIFISLFIGSLTRTALHGTSVPYTVVLFCLGMLEAVINYYLDLGMLESSLESWGNINPHVLLAAFLPALIFESSFSMEWHTLKKVLPKVLILAGPGVLMTMGLAGCVLRMFPFGLSWSFCMMVGSILAATDPVAVVAILKEVGASKTLGHLIEGESLVNDGTAIVVFNVFLTLAKGEEKSFGSIMKDLITQPLLSVVVGVGFGHACMYWIQYSRRDHLVDITITLFAAYIAFMLAETVLKCSGVLAVVVLGWYLSAKGRTFFKGDVQHSMHHFWEVLTYAANTVVFILAGFLIVGDILVGELDIRASDLGWSVLLYLLLNIIRGVVTAMLFPLMNMSKAYKCNLREMFIAVWAGLRGAVGLALALVVLEEHDYFTKRERGLTLVLVSAGVVGTLLINATSSAAMLRVVGLLTPGLSHERTLLAARKAIHERAMTHYDNKLDETGAKYLGAPDFTAIKQLVPFLRTQNEETEIEFNREITKMDEQLMHEMRSRFLAGLCKEIWSMLEDDLIDAKVAHGLLVACERATDRAKTDAICSLAEFNHYMQHNRVKSALVKWLEHRTLGQKLLGVLRYLKLADEPWMATRRQMQGLHALITAHHLTSKQFKSLLGKDEEEEEEEEEEMEQEAQPTDQVRTLAREYTIKVSPKGLGDNLAAETSIKVNHVRNVIIESDDEVIHAVEMLKEMQHAHNAVARSLRSEALAREILEVTMAETRLLTHTGLLDESEGSALQAEHDLYLQRIIMNPLPPSRTSPGRILASLPLFDFTMRVGIKSRGTRKHFLREAEVIEFVQGDVVIDPDAPPRRDIFLIGNGVVRIEDSNDVNRQFTAGVKSDAHAWAAGLYESLANEPDDEEPARSGVRVIADAKMFGFIIPHSLLHELREDPRESETLEHLWRTVFGVLSRTTLKKALDALLPGAPTNKLVRAGRLVKISKGTKLEHDPKQVVVLLRGSLYNDTCGSLPAPLVVTFRKSDTQSTSGQNSLLEKKLASRMLSMKFGKNGLVRASSQNLVALETTELEKEKTSESGEVEDDTLICFESANDLLLYVIPADLAVVKQAVFSSPKKRLTKKDTFLKSFSKKMSRMETSPRSPRRGVEFDRNVTFDPETGAGAPPPRAPERHLSMIGAGRHSEDHPRTQYSAGSGIAISEDDQAQHTFLSSGSAEYGQRSTIYRTLTSGNYEDPSTQHTIA